MEKHVRIYVILISLSRSFLVSEKEVSRMDQGKERKKGGGASGKEKKGFKNN